MSSADSAAAAPRPSEQTIAEVDHHLADCHRRYLDAVGAGDFETARRMHRAVDRLLDRRLRPERGQLAWTG